MKKVLQILSLLLCIICVNSSCNKETTKRELIIGKWECVIASSQNGQDEIEHNIGGRWEFNDKTVSIRDGYNIEIEMGEDTYSFDEKKAILTIGNNDGLKFYVSKLTNSVLILDGMITDIHLEFNRTE